MNNLKLNVIILIINLITNLIKYFQTELKPNLSKVRFLNVSRVNPEKGIFEFLEMFKELKLLVKEITLSQEEYAEKFGKNKKFVIIEGRDIGTVIFPDARYKIYMWADAKIRSERRYNQIRKKGQKTSLKRIYREIIARDTKDLGRKIAPLKPAANSVLLDTTYLDIEQTFNAIKKILKQ